MKQANSILMGENIQKINPFGIPFVPDAYDSQSSEEDYMDGKSSKKRGTASFISNFKNPFK